MLAKIKDGWIVCAKCGHKLGKIISENEIEIKCSSCKELNNVKENEENEQNV